jgi:predicted acetyltransferase
MQDLLDKAEASLRSARAGIDSRGVVSCPKRARFPISDADMNTVFDWIGERIDFGESRSSYAIQSAIQLATHSSDPVSNGAVIAVAIGLGNEFDLDPSTLEISFPNRLLLVPFASLPTPSFRRLSQVSNESLGELNDAQKETLSHIVIKEFNTLNFGFKGNLTTILNSPYLLGIFDASQNYIGFVVCTSETDLSPCYLEIFPDYRKRGHGETVAKLLMREMRGHLSVIECIPSARMFWNSVGYKFLEHPFEKRNILMAKVC